MTIATVFGDIARVVHALGDEGGFSPFAFCLADDAFTTNAMLLAARLRQVGLFLVPGQLLRLAWYVRHGWRVVVVRPGRLLVLLALAAASCWVEQVLVEVDLLHAFWRLQAMWAVWTAVVTLLTAVMLPFHIRIERVFGSMEMRPGPP